MSLRTLKRNQQVFWYAGLIGDEPVVNELGQLTGEYTLSYTNPVRTWANISAEKGRAFEHIFGLDLDYDRVIVFDMPQSLRRFNTWGDYGPKGRLASLWQDLLDVAWGTLRWNAQRARENSSFPIKETSILWVDVVPVVREGGKTSTPHDYVVRKVARSLNGVSVAIKKVDVNGP